MNFWYLGKLNKKSEFCQTPGNIFCDLNSNLNALESGSLASSTTFNIGWGLLTSLMMIVCYYRRFWHRSPVYDYRPFCSKISSHHWTHLIASYDFPISSLNSPSVSSYLQYISLKPSSSFFLIEIHLASPSLGLVSIKDFYTFTRSDEVSWYCVDVLTTYVDFSANTIFQTIPCLKKIGVVYYPLLSHTEARTEPSRLAANDPCLRNDQIVYFCILKGEKLGSKVPNTFIVYL